MEINTFQTNLRSSSLKQITSRSVYPAAFLNNDIHKRNVNNKVDSILLKAYYGISFGLSIVKVPSAKDFLNKFAELNVSPKDFIFKTMLSNQPIGTGGEGTVYNIPELENYVLKVPYWFSHEDIKNLASDKFSPVKTNLGDLNVGQPIYELDSVKILYKVKGENFTLNGNLSDENAYKRRLRIASSMPQEAYDDLANITIKLNQLGHCIDPGIENVLIERGKSFNPIDIHFDHKTKTTYTDILELLVGSDVYVDEFSNPDNIKYLKTVLNKCIKSCKKEGIPLFCPDKKTPGYKNDMEYLKGIFHITGIKVRMTDLTNKYSKMLDAGTFETYIDDIFSLTKTY